MQNKAKLSIALYIAYCLMAGPVMAQVTNCKAKPSSNGWYRLFRPDDINREKIVAKLSLKDGRPDLQGISTTSLAAAETQFGKAREWIDRSPGAYITDPSKRIFDLVGIGVEKSPEFFHISVQIENGYISKYLIDGPGITHQDWVVAKKGEAG